MNIGLKLNINVAAALWSASVINAITDQGAEGFSSQALQQGGIGLLLTVLIISVPPLAAAFFQGTVGQFLHFSAFGGGAGSRPGPQGQPPGSYGGYGGHNSPAALGHVNPSGQSAGGVRAYDANGARARPAYAPATAQADLIRPTSAAPTTQGRN